MAKTFRESEFLFSRTLVQAIIAWNNVEWAAQRILGAFIRGGVGSFVVLHHLKNVALQDALLATADLLDDPRTPSSAEIAEHVRHFVEAYDRLRVYRNFYIHSMKALVRGDDPTECVAALHETEAKGRLSWVDHRLTYEELATFLSHLRDLEAYGESLADYVSPPNALSGIASKAQPLASLQKPIWLEKLKKNRSYPSKLPPPPESSPA